MLKKVMPTKLIIKLRKVKDIITYWELRSEIIAYLKSQNSTEYKSIADYIRKRYLLPVFPYGFADKYDSLSWEVYDEDGYPYVVHNGKKLYGPKSWTKDEWRDYYIGLLCEQDCESPHCYLRSGRDVTAEDIVADVGAAEGIFSLDIVETVGKIYLFECDEKWLVPLQKTFAPWKDKVEFVQKYVSDRTEEEKVSLDVFFAGKKITFLKADIEGAERLMLYGGKEVFQKKISRCLVCCYHLHDDRIVLEKILDNYGYEFEENPGYMIFKYDRNGLSEPFLRKGVIYGVRKI